MVWFALAQVVSFVVDLVLITRQGGDRDKDLEILLLRHQVRLLQRRQARAPCLSRREKLTLAVLVTKAAHLADGPHRRLGQLILLFQPETLLRWHRELVRRKWTFARRGPTGRPPIAAELEALIVRLAGENPGWGYCLVSRDVTGWDASVPTGGSIADLGPRGERPTLAVGDGGAHDALHRTACARLRR